MTRQRLIPIVTVGAVLFALLVGPTPAQAKTSARVVISPEVGLGIWIGRDVDRYGHHGPFRGPMVPGPWRRRSVPGWTPFPKVVVVPPPVVRPVVVPPAPVIEPEPATITVWITNSNGSMTSIQLTREGPWYRGPRGEYYTSMPTNEQLRVVYGF
jgi:hypothetical protein